MDTSLQAQIKKFQTVFPGSINEKLAEEILDARLSFPSSDDYTEIKHLLIVPTTLLSTKLIFKEIDLGRKEANTWFIDEERIHDLPGSLSEMFSILRSVNVSNVFLPEKFKNVTPLTLHETAILLFQFPNLISGFAQGVQALGSRFSVNEDQQQTLEFYRKGNSGEAFLKLAKEEVPYWDYSKLVPHYRGRTSV